MSKKQEATAAKVTYSAFDALEVIYDFLNKQIAEAQAYFKAQAFGTVEFNEEQAFLKTLHTAAAIYRAYVSENHGLDLIQIAQRIHREYLNACRATCDADRLACDEVSVTEQREAQARSAAWGMVYHFVNAQYRRSNAA